MITLGLSCLAQIFLGASGNENRETPKMNQIPGERKSTKTKKTHAIMGHVREIRDMLLFPDGSTARRGRSEAPSGSICFLMTRTLREGGVSEEAMMCAGKAMNRRTECLCYLFSLSFLLFFLRRGLGHSFIHPSIQCSSTYPSTLMFAASK